MRVCMAVSLHAFFHIFVHVRTRIASFIPVCLIPLSCLIFVPPLKLNDASNSFNNVLILGVVTGGHWFAGLNFRSTTILDISY